MIGGATEMVPEQDTRVIPNKSPVDLRPVQPDNFYCNFYIFKTKTCVLFCCCVYQLKVRLSSVLCGIWCFVVVSSN